MVFGRALAMLAVGMGRAHCTITPDEGRAQVVLFDQIGVHAVTSQEHVGGGGHRLLRAGTASRSLFDKDDGCGGERQSVCKGDELKGREFECDFGYTREGGICVPYAEKGDPIPYPDRPTSTPAGPEPQEQPTPPSSPGGGSQEVEYHVGLQSNGCSDQMVQEMVLANNDVRKENGLKPLYCDDKLSASALEWSKHMCNSREMNHDDFEEEGGRCDDIRSQTGFDECGEILGWGTYSLDEQVSMIHDGETGWTNSVDHLNQIKAKPFTAVGYGYIVCQNGPDVEEDGQPREGGPMDREVMYWSGHFGCFRDTPGCFAKTPQ